MHTDDYLAYLNDVLVSANSILFVYMRDHRLLNGDIVEPGSSSSASQRPVHPDFPLCRLTALYKLSDFQVYCISLALLYEARQDFSIVFADANEGKTIPDLHLAKRSYEYSRGSISMKEFLEAWDDDTIGQLLYEGAAQKNIFDTRLVLHKRIYAFLLCEQYYENNLYAHLFSRQGSPKPPDTFLQRPYRQLLNAIQKREDGVNRFFYITGKAASGRKTLAIAVLNALGKEVIFVNLCSLSYDNERLLKQQIAVIKRECILTGAVAVPVDFEYLLKESPIPNSTSVAGLFAESMLSVYGYALFITENIVHFGDIPSVYIEIERSGMKKLNPAVSEILKTKASFIPPHFDWDDLMLPQNQKWLLTHICNYVTLKSVVYEEWGFGERFVYGRGLNVLFEGPPGTGKTMAAQILSQKLGLGLYKIDLAQIVSKYIGETEENLRIIFDEAEKSGIILMIDEMDALFGKRTKAKDAHDRYANMETSYLLQRIESFEGIVIMATNLLKNIDEAFMRRLNFIVHFPFPAAEIRRKIWVSMTRDIPVDDSVDFDFLAEKFEITGGLIKNVILKAAFLAASEERSLTEKHILYAMKNELSKQGKVLLGTDFL